MLWKYNCEEWKYGILQHAASAADLLNPGSTFRPHRRRIIDNLTRRKASFQTLDKYNLTLYQAKIYISLDYQILNWIFVHKATKDIMINVQIIRIGSVLPHNLVQLLKYFDVTSSHWCRCQVCLELFFSPRGGREVTSRSTFWHSDAFFPQVYPPEMVDEKNQGRPWDLHQSPIILATAIDHSLSWWCLQSTFTTVMRLYLFRDWSRPL